LVKEDIITLAGQEKIVFNVDEKLAILYITLRIIALSLDNKGVDE